MKPGWYDLKSHAQVLGTSQSGKSKFLEHCMREQIEAGNGFSLIDWHGTLYKDVFEYLAYLQPDRPIILMNPSQPDFITPFNPFLKKQPETSALVSRLLQTAQSFS